MEAGRAGETAALRDCPRVAPGERFAFACAGCGECCRDRRDLILSGFDLWRLARWMRLPPRTVAAAFCQSRVGEDNCLPFLRLTPDPATGHCRFFEGGGCSVHPARPLACALYPLGQSIDTRTAQTEYFVQTPLCGVQADTPRTLTDYLRDSGVADRAGIDARWAVVCTRISERLLQAGGAEHPRFRTAVRRIEKALYYDYTTRDEFYPQFQKNTEEIFPLLERILENE